MEGLDTATYRRRNVSDVKLILCWNAANGLESLCNGLSKVTFQTIFEFRLRNKTYTESTLIEIYRL
jgi:hypothetical protein